MRLIGRYLNQLEFCSIAAPFLQKNRHHEQLNLFDGYPTIFDQLLPFLYINHDLSFPFVNNSEQIPGFPCSNFPCSKDPPVLFYEADSIKKEPCDEAPPCAKDSELEYAVFGDGIDN